MSDRLIPAHMHGFTAPVVRARAADATAAGHQGIGTSAILDPITGLPVLAVTIRHLDGDMVTALLGEEEVHRLADMMADFVEALPSLGSRARH